MIGFGRLVGPLSHSVLYLLRVLARRSPSSDFGENQLSRGLISLSLLPSGHLRIFQHPRVRPSTWCYPGFSLPKGRSPPLRVYCPRLNALFALAFASPPALRALSSPRTITRGLIMQKARRHRLAAAPTPCRHGVAGSVSLPSSGFFSPFPHGTGALSVAREYLGLPGGPGGFARSFTCIVLLGIPPGGLGFSPTRLSRSMAALSRAFG